MTWKPRVDKLSLLNYTPTVKITRRKDGAWVLVDQFDQMWKIIPVNDRQSPIVLERVERDKLLPRLSEVPVDPHGHRKMALVNKGGA